MGLWQRCPFVGKWKQKCRWKINDFWFLLRSGDENFKMISFTIFLSNFIDKDCLRHFWRDRVTIAWKRNFSIVENKIVWFWYLLSICTSENISLLKLANVSTLVQLWAFIQTSFMTCTYVLYTHLSQMNVYPFGHL